MIVKLLSYNIRFGGLKREKELAEVIRGVSPDLVVFQEAIDADVISRLAAETELESLRGDIAELQAAHLGQPVRRIESSD